ncbi:MAG: hypothetical protein ACXVBE_11510 [Bdellovibrionota bacterium]
MLRSALFTMLALSAVTAQANSTFDVILKDESVSYRFNSNELRCDPGSKNGFEVPATVAMDVPSPMFDYNGGGRKYVNSNIHKVGLSLEPERCDKIAHLVNQPNPNWRLADAHRVVKERYYQVSNARCDKSLVEELTITIQGEKELTFTGVEGFFIESLPVARCNFNVEK